MTNNEIWEIVARTPDLPFKRNLQKRLTGNFGFLFSKDGNVEGIFQFLITWINFKVNGLLSGIFFWKTFQIPISL